MLLVTDLSARIAGRRHAIDEALGRVVASGWVILGPEVRGFEEIFAAHLGARHCVGVANGTDAIEIALRAVGVGPGDTVATPANAGFYATTALLAIGASPLFMDCAAQDHGTPRSEVAHALSEGARAVVVTHLYGMANREIAAIAADCRRAGVPLIEDCAQAHGAHVDGIRVGTFGAASTFSFYPTKNLGALGDGGAVVTQDDAFAAEARLLRQYGWTTKYAAARAGSRNSRLDEMQAAVLRAFLPFLDADNARRRELALRYGQSIRHAAVRLPLPPEAGDVVHLFVVRSAGRDGLRDHLRGCQVASDIHYPIPDHRQAMFGDRFAALRLPHAEAMAREVLTLPCYPEMTDAQADLVIAAVNGWPA